VCIDYWVTLVLAFCPCDLDIDSINLTHEHDILTIRLRTKIKSPGKCFQKLEPEKDRHSPTDRQTNATERITSRLKLIRRWDTWTWHTGYPRGSKVVQLDSTDMISCHCGTRSRILYRLLPERDYVTISHKGYKIRLRVQWMTDRKSYP